jgi:hypothetical protein
MADQQTLDMLKTKIDELTKQQEHLVGQLNASMGARQVCEALLAELTARAAGDQEGGKDGDAR